MLVINETGIDHRQSDGTIFITQATLAPESVQAIQLQYQAPALTIDRNGEVAVTTY